MCAEICQFPAYAMPICEWSSSQVPTRHPTPLLSWRRYMQPPISVSMCAGMVFAFNAYHIGKERCYFQVSRSLGLSIWVSARRLKTLQRLNLPEEWMACITHDKQAADVVVSDSGVGPPQLQELHAELGKPVIGFQCTGALRPSH